MNIEQTFLQDCVKRFNYYKSLADRTFEQLEEKDFFFKPSPESNNITVIIQHMHGNMMSRWSNFLTEDGEKEWRRRDEEFEDLPLTSEHLLGLWEQGWSLLLSTLLSLSPDDLRRTIYIRSEPLTVYDAILRQLAHYSYHVGQIVFIGKMMLDNEFSSLSIPRQRRAGSDHQTQQKS